MSPCWTTCTTSKLVPVPNLSKVNSKQTGVVDTNISPLKLRNLKILLDKIQLHRDHFESNQSFHKQLLFDKRTLSKTWTKIEENTKLRQTSDMEDSAEEKLLDIIYKPHK